MTPPKFGKNPNGEENKFPNGIDVSTQPAHAKTNSLKQFIIDSSVNKDFGPFLKLLMSYLIKKSPEGQDTVKVWPVYVILSFIGINVLLGFAVTVLEFGDLIGICD